MKLTLKPDKYIIEIETIHTQYELNKLFIKLKNELFITSFNIIKVDNEKRM